jgi:hypothetical protein
LISVFSFKVSKVPSYGKRIVRSGSRVSAVFVEEVRAASAEPMPKDVCRRAAESPGSSISKGRTSKGRDHAILVTKTVR